MREPAIEMLWEVQMNEYGTYLIGAFKETLMMDGTMADLFTVLATTPIEEVARTIVYEHNENLFRI